MTNCRLGSYDALGTVSGAVSQHQSLGGLVRPDRQDALSCITTWTCLGACTSIMGSLVRTHSILGIAGWSPRKDDFDRVGLRSWWTGCRAWRGVSMLRPNHRCVTFFVSKYQWFRDGTCGVAGHVCSSGGRDIDSIVSWACTCD